MKIKEFEALTLRECLGQVRNELGPEAVILETRKSKRGGILGWGARDAVRIIAGTGIAVRDEENHGCSHRSTRASKSSAESPQAFGAAAPNRRGRPKSTEPAVERLPMTAEAAESSTRGRPDMAAFLAQHAAATEGKRLAAEDCEPETNTKLSQLEREIRDVKAALKELAEPVAVVRAHESCRTAEAAPSRAVLYPALLQRLLDADVREDIALSLLGKLPDPGRWAAEIRQPMAIQALTDIMSARINAAGPPDLGGAGRKIVTLVGPTGVGKTTTIAKVAAHYALVQKRRVGLITMDTYRIAAVEQLRSYSQIIGIPIEVVHNPKELRPALEKLSDCDLVLIDTAGRSQKDVMQVNELKALVLEADCETHLVLSATTRERELRDQIHRFSVIGVDRLIFSKLDETTTFGTVFNMTQETNLPLSFFTTGQKVPEDLEAASPTGLVNRILNG